jgi:hypothetical protein
MTSAQALALVNTLADIVYARVSNPLERAAVSADLRHVLGANLARLPAGNVIEVSSGD